MNQLKSCSSFFVSDEPLGTTRVWKGTLGSLPLGLLTPIVPCCIIYWAFIGIYMLWGLNLKMINDWKSVRMRSILMEIRHITEKEPKEMDLGWAYHNIEIYKIFFVHVMPAWLSYCFNPIKGEWKQLPWEEGSSRIFRVRVKTQLRWVITQVRMFITSFVEARVAI